MHSLLLLLLLTAAAIDRLLHCAASIRLFARIADASLCRVLDLDSEGHLRLVHARLVLLLLYLGGYSGLVSRLLLLLLLLGRIVDRSLGRVLLILLLLRMLLKVLNVLTVLGSLLDHTVQLLLSHADHWQLAHLRVADHSRLLQELLLEAGEKMMLIV